MSRAAKCPRRFGPFGVCGAVLEMTTVDGRLVVYCWACDRLARGLCRECQLPVAGMVGMARRCLVHKKAAALAQSERHRDRNRAEVNRQSKLRMRKPDVLARQIANLRAWRRKNPEKVKAQRDRRIIRQVRAARRVA